MMFAGQTAQVLGLSPTPYAAITWVSDAVVQGLPLASLDRVTAAIAPDDSAFIHRIVPRPTLTRRRSANAPLSSDESAKVARLAEVWAMAMDVWGTEDSAREFLFRKHQMLGMQRPVDVVLANEFGGQAVMGILGRLQYGSAV